MLQGPSCNLPEGQDLCDLSIYLRTHRLRVSISDRRDFYHQLWATRARAITNTLGPGLPVEMVKDTEAFQTFLLTDVRKKYSRERHGDRLGLAAGPEVNEGLVWASFKSVLQGDHGGVEIATDARSRLLQMYGLLSEDVHLVANRPSFDSTAVEGLVIDDFFSVSVDEKATPATQSRSHSAYTKAQEAYKDFELLGSPEKDVVAQPEGKVIGAYLNGGPQTVAQGVCTVGAPAQKRLALSFLTLQACALPYTTVSLHRCVVGAWVSMLLYRRPMMNLLNEAFVVNERFSDIDEGALVPLSRKVAEELVMCAVLAPLMLSDIAVGFEDMVYATDASESRGAICSSFLGSDIAFMLSKICRTKGAYTRLSKDSNDVHPFPITAEGLDDESGDSRPPGIQRPVAFRFEFIEVFAGSSRISAAMSELGVNVGPPLDISIFEGVHVLSWLFHLIEEGRLLAIALEPPCAT